MKRPELFWGNDDIDDYIEELETVGRRDSTITINLWMLANFFKSVGHTDVSLITKEDIDKYIRQLRKDGRSGKKKESTINNNIVALRSFFNWKCPENDWFKKQKIKPVKCGDPDKHWATREDILKMINVCISQRDRALLMILWESGGRVSEITGLDRKDVHPDKYGAIINVNGKTGKRAIRIIDSVPDVQLYLNQTHGGPESPLFPTSVTGRLTTRGVQNTLNRLAKRAEIPYKI
ncbi:MAG: tyrosine-type recombinase/integrase, partial [Methanosarcina sp.]